ncbi:MAG: lipocalin family protein [Spirochaetales bacterium]|nr:lipocalin family protein [Spirochaetales bacterium]
MKKSLQKKTKLPILSLLAAITVIFIASCASVPPKGMDPLELVDQVDLDRYLGRWYEVGRYQHRFEDDLVGATAEYSLRDDGRVQVVNSGFKDTLDGPYREVKAVAWRPDPAVPGALKVKFFGLFVSDYMILGLDEENYRWAVVGNNSRDFLWFLARDHEIDEELFQKMTDIAAGQGFDTRPIYRVPQKTRD